MNHVRCDYNAQLSPFLLGRQQSKTLFINLFYFQQQSLYDVSHILPDSHDRAYIYASLVNRLVFYISIKNINLNLCRSLCEMHLFIDRYPFR